MTIKQAKDEIANSPKMTELKAKIEQLPAITAETELAITQEFDRYILAMESQIKQYQVNWNYEDSAFELLRQTAPTITEKDK